MAYLFLRHWMHIHIACGIMSTCAVIAYILIPESVRWLAQNGREDEARVILLKAAKTNGVELTEKQTSNIDAVLARVAEASKLPIEKKLSPLTMLKPSYLRSTLIITFVWIVVNVGSYTLLLNSAKLSGNLFWNYILLSLTYLVPGTAFMVSKDHVSQKHWLAITTATLGVACITLAFIPKDLTTGVLIVFLIGKMATNGTFSLVYMLSSELFPTNLRNQSLATSSTIARVFGLVCPYVANLSVYWKPLPMLVLGIPALVATLLVMMLPDTTEKGLPQNMVQGIELNSLKKSTADTNTNK
jgi:OCT family organic cation transporter-like MFS transporter 4/5